MPSRVQGDRELLDRLVNGDPAAFDVIYDRYRPRIFRFLLRMTRRRDLAEDLLQETWLRFARSARTIEDGALLERWLFRVARNLVISRWRVVLPELVSLEELQILPPDKTEPSPFERVLASELERALERAVASLPLGHREVILLLGGEDLDPKDVAEILRIKPEALRQRLSRARSLLRKRLDRELGSTGRVKEAT